MLDINVVHKLSKHPICPPSLDQMFDHFMNSFQHLNGRWNKFFKSLLRNLVFNHFTKELSFCHKILLSNLNIFATQCRRPLIFPTMNAVRSNNQILKYQWFTSSGSKDK